MKYCKNIFILLILILFITGCNENSVEDKPDAAEQPIETPISSTPAPPTQTSIPLPVPQPVGSIKPEAPQFKLLSSLYDRAIPVVVEITCPETNGKIYYTLNGTRPNVDSNIYTGPVTVLDKDGTMVVLSALFITDEGAVSDLTYERYQHKVAFKDKAVEAILFDYFKPEDGIIKYSMLSQIREFIVIGDFAMVNNSEEFAQKIGYDIKKYYYEYDSAIVTKRGDIETLDDLTMLPYLNTVVVNYNQLSDFPDFSDQGLDIIDLKDNFIKDISNLGTNVHLNVLALDNNLITDLGFLGGDNYCSINNFSLSNNPIEKYPDFSDNFYMENMWLDGTGLEGWPQFKGFTYIKMLDLSNNNITVLPKPPTLMRIDTLILRGNNMTDISNIPGIQTNEVEGLGGIVKTDITGYCKHLDISNNAIDDIRPLLELSLTESLIIQNNSVPLDMDIIKLLTWMDEVIID